VSILTDQPTKTPPLRLRARGPRHEKQRGDRHYLPAAATRRHRHWQLRSVPIFATEGHEGTQRSVTRLCDPSAAVRAKEERRRRESNSPRRSRGDPCPKDNEEGDSHWRQEVKRRRRESNSRPMEGTCFQDRLRSPSPEPPPEERGERIELSKSFQTPGLQSGCDPSRVPRREAVLVEG
jgi:hypothetical protein